MKCGSSLNMCSHWCLQQTERLLYLKQCHELNSFIVTTKASFENYDTLNAFYSSVYTIQNSKKETVPNTPNIFSG